MPCGKKSSKKTSGLTLMELVVTAALLMIILAPILGMFVQGSRTNMASNNLSSAAVTAQLRMEELVGLSREELCTEFAADPASVKITSLHKNYNGFTVGTEVTFNYEALDMESELGETIPYNQLAEATVIVYDSDGVSELCSQTNILQVAL